MNILITGATGCLGRHLVTKLATPSNHITAIGRNLSVGKTLENAYTRFIITDICDEKKIMALVQHNDAVIHCAALTSPWGRYKDFFHTNVVGTRNLVEASLKFSISRFVHVSSSSIYHNGHARLNIHENDPLPKQAVNHYATTKKLAEEVVDYACQKGLPAITIRPRAIFGPYDTAIFPRLIRVASKGRFPLFSSGRAITDVTYVANVVDALILCLNAPKQALGKKYNISNDEPMTIKALVEQLFTALALPVKFYSLPYPLIYTIATLLEAIHHVPPFLNHEPLLTRYAASNLSLSQTLDIRAAKSDLGYAPQVSIAEGLKEFARWWYEQTGAR